MKSHHDHRRWFLQRALALGAVLGLPAVALAHGAHGRRDDQHEDRGEWRKARLRAQVEDALDACKASQAQRKAVTAELDGFLGQSRPDPKEREARRAEWLALLSSDQPDPKAVQLLLLQQLERHGKRAAEVGAALQRLHGQFDPAQRKAMSAWARAELPIRGGHWRQKMMAWGMERRLGAALDRLEATAEQRKAVLAITDKAKALLGEHRNQREAHLTAVLTAWEGERLDDKAVRGLLDAHRAAAQATAQRGSQLALELHRVLTPAQRAKVAEFIQSRGHGHGMRWHARGGGAEE